MGHEQALADRLPEQDAMVNGGGASRLNPVVLGFLAVLALVTTALLLPLAVIDRIASRWPWIGLVLQRVEDAHLAVNLLHVALFVPLGIAMACALPRQRFSSAAGLLLGLGMLTEALQRVIPGRHARLSDVGVDLFAGLAGWCLVWLLRAFRRRWKAQSFHSE